MDPYIRRAFSGTAPDSALATDIDDTTLTFALTDATGWPTGSAPFEVTFAPETLDEEKNWGTRSGTTITLLARGMEGNAVSHTAGTVVRHGLSALDMDEANYAVSQTVGQITAKGSLLAGSAAHTLTEVTAGSAGQSPVWASDGSVSAGNPDPAAHSHAETDVTDLSDTLASLSDQANTNALNIATNTANITTLQTQVAAGLGLLAHVDYTSTSALLGTSLAVVDATNLSPAFTVPSSGKVLVRVSGRTDPGNTAGTLSVGWLNHSGGAQVGRTQTTWKAGANALETLRFSCAQTLTGLTAGALQLDLAAAFSSASQHKLTDVTLEVWAA